MEKSWYVVTTKLNCELKLATQLSKKKIESFCPLNNISNNTWLKKRGNIIPLFQSIVFVHISKYEIPLVKQTNEVVNFLYWLGAPATISREEIESLKQFTTDYSDIKIEKIPVDQLGVMQITRIPYAVNFDKSGSFKYTSVKIMFPSLGYSLMASVKLSMNNVFDLSSHAKIG